ncbi:MAG: Gfo/Idh/MocA family oxidoreductase [Bryobacteraceae bacterium]|nr:Gfo/Idh/MocA family oxidoreductase [Bryobacteraceae bacterium]
MRVGIIGTGAIAHKHAQAYRNIGFIVAAINDNDISRAEAFSALYGGEVCAAYQEVCRHENVDFIDVCTFPDFRLQPLKVAAQAGKHVQVQKPIAIDVKTARGMVEFAAQHNVLLNVVSQHRFDDSIQFLKTAILSGRMGKIVQADAYVKWWRTAEYYSRPVKGSWHTEGGGALINQGIHQVDMLLYLCGPVAEVFGYWQLGAVHKIESEDVITAAMRYASGATGVIQSSTAMWPGYTERLELHGTKGTAIVSGDKLTAWDVQDDAGDPAPLAKDVASGASDPMAISLEPFERQFRDFGEAIRAGRPPLSSGEEGLRALELVAGIYDSCRTGEKVRLGG